VLVVKESGNGLTQAALTELAGLLMATSSFEDLMQAVADLAGRAVPAASTCGITLSENGHVITVASADPLARLLDEQQYEVDDGPCLEAIRSGRVVIADDLSIETRWDGYPAMAVAHGVRSVLSSPLLVNDAPIGALNLYALTEHAFTPDSRSAAAQLTALAAATVTAAMRHYDESTLTDHLRTALSSRSVIDQAIGIIIGMQRCPPDTAFDILRPVSQNRNIPLRDVAADLVAKTIAPPPPTITT
jgi:GAF domain-containing protein